MGSSEAPVVEDIRRFTPVRGVIYLAGKVSGDLADAKKRFKAVQLVAEAHGNKVWNPLERAASKEAVEEAEEHGAKAAGKPHWQKTMQKCFMDVVCCHEVWLLPGWRESTGARFEVLVALMAGVPVYEYSEWLDNDPNTFMLTPLTINFETLCAGVFSLIDCV